MSEKLTTAQAAARLGVAQPTVKLWCRQGKFPNAKLDETPRGPVWQIPEGDLKGFEPPKMGRPPATSKTASGSKGKVAVKKAAKKGGKK